MPDIASISGKCKNINFWPSSLIRNDSKRSSQAQSIPWDCHRPLLIIQLLPLPNPASITLTGFVLKVHPHPPPLINLLYVNLLLRRFLGDLTLLFYFTCHRAHRTQESTVFAYYNVSLPGQIIFPHTLHHCIESLG